MAKIVFIRSAEHDITNAIPRAIEAAGECFDEIHVLCWALTRKDLPSREIRGDVTIRRFVWPARLRGLKGLVGLLLFQFWLAYHLLRLRPRVVQALDFLCIWPAAGIGRLCGAYCVYDIRDPFADSLGFRPIVRRVLYGLDWTVMGLCHAFVLPSEERRGYLGVWARRGRPLLVVLNTCEDELPSLAPGSPVGERGAGDLRLAYVGYITSTRGAGLLADAARRFGGRVKLIVAGDIRDPALKERMEGADSVFLLGRVARTDALQVMRDADVVTLLYDPAIPVNRVAAPNKLYESLCLGTPVLVAKGMSIAELVAESGLGWVIDYGSTDQLDRVIEDLANPVKMQELRSRCRQYFLDRCSFEAEMEKYRKFYRKFSAPVASTAGSGYCRQSVERRTEFYERN
jgi:glycosyltransferase involved in cell wall biosynthesis